MIKVENIKINRVFIIGNGFSCTCGLPIASKLFEKLTIYEEIPECFYGDTLGHQRVMDILDTYFMYTKVSPSLEDFFNFLYSIVAFTKVSPRHRDIFDSEISDFDFKEALLFVMKWIEAYLWNFCELVGDKKNYKHILSFAKSLENNDTIITFNYDILLEKALNDLGKPFSYNRGDGVLTILKPHGSINWFQVTAEIEKETANYVPLDKEKKIFKYNHFYTHIGEPLKAQSFIVPPTMLKLYESQYLIELWEQAKASILNADKLVFIGYSLPKEDQFARIFFRNSTNNEYDRNVYVINPSSDIKNTYKNYVIGRLIFKKRKFHESLLRDKYIFS